MCDSGAGYNAAVLEPSTGMIEVIEASSWTISWTSNTQENTIKARPLHSLPSFTECFKILPKWVPFRQGLCDMRSCSWTAYMYLSIQLWIVWFLAGAALHEKWQDNMNWSGAHSIHFKKLCSNSLHGNANTISWYTAIFELVGSGCIKHPPDAQNTKKKNLTIDCIYDEHK